MFTPAAAKLQVALAHLFPSEAEGRILCEAAGMKTNLVDFSAASYTRLYFIVDQATKQSKLPELIAAALERYPDSEELLATSAPWLETARTIRGSKLPVLIAAIGSDSMLSLDLASLRAVRTSTGMKFQRIQDASLASLKVALDRARMNGRQANVHLAVHASPQGVLLGGVLVDAVALSEILDGVQVLVLAGCQSDQLGDNLGVVPSVISFSEDVSNTDASLFARLFWEKVGRGATAENALGAALKLAPSGLGEFVIGNFAKGV